MHYLAGFNVTYIVYLHSVLNYLFMYIVTCDDKMIVLQLIIHYMHEYRLWTYSCFMVLMGYYWLFIFINCKHAQCVI